MGQANADQLDDADGSQPVRPPRARRDAVLTQQAGRSHPARRADLTQPVPADQRDQLPTQTTKHKDGSKTTRLTKDAFIYDKAINCDWCLVNS